MELPCQNFLPHQEVSLKQGKMSSLLSKIQPKGGAFIQSQKFMTWKVEQDYSFVFPHDSVMYM